MKIRYHHPGMALPPPHRQPPIHVLPTDASHFQCATPVHLLLWSSEGGFHYTPNWHYVLAEEFDIDAIGINRWCVKCVPAAEAPD